MWVCLVQKQAAGVDYKSVFMESKKLQKTGCIWDKRLWWRVALQKICLEIQTWSQTEKKAEIPMKFLTNAASRIVDEVGEIPLVEQKHLFIYYIKSSESEWND